jgi:hypothetical protein
MSPYGSQPGTQSMDQHGASQHLKIRLCSVQRRCYWLLEGNDNVVLVHYLSSNPQDNCVMRGPPPNGGALSLNAVELPKPAPQVRSLPHLLRRFSLACLLLLLSIAFCGC